MELELTGKRAIVTGAGRGIGRTTALRLAELGCDVAVVDLALGVERDTYGESNTPTTEEIEKIGRRALGIEADLTLEESAKRIIDTVVEAWGGFDFLVNVAGGAVTPFEVSGPVDAPIADVRKLMDMNYMSAVYMCQAAAPVLRETEGAAIVNTTSIQSTQVLPGGKNAAYGASKAALMYYTRCLAEDLGPQGIRVNAVAPGYTLSGRVKQNASTGFAEKGNDAALRRLGKPEDIADGVAFLVSPGASYITGHELSVNGGLRLV